MRKIWLGIEQFIYNLVIRFYRLPNDEITECDLIVPHCYGLLWNATLPDATRRTLTEAVILQERFWTAKILTASSITCFGEHGRHTEDALKTAFLRSFGAHGHYLLPGIENTVGEVRAVHAVIAEGCIRSLDLADHDHITVICDAAHMRSVRRIWREVFADMSGVKISIRGVRARWNEPHRLFLQRSPLRWLAANVLRDLALQFRGIDYVAGITHPVKR